MAISKKIIEEANTIYGKFLALNSMFFTKERKLILSMALAQTSHFSADELQFDIQNDGLNITLAKQSKNAEIKVSMFFELLAHLLPSRLICIQKCSRLAPIV